MKDNHKSALIVLQDTVRNELCMEILCVLVFKCSMCKNIKSES